MAVRLFVVSQHPLYLEGMRLVLAREPELDVVGTATTRDDARTLAGAAQADVGVVVALEVDDATVALAETVGGSTPVVVVADCKSDVDVERLAAAGARGVVACTQDATDAVAAVRAVAAGETCPPPPVARRPAEVVTFPSEAVRGDASGGATANGADPLACLTSRERQVYELLVDGASNTVIGRRLGISAKTADTHRTHILRKLGLHSVVQLVRFAARHQLLPELRGECQQSEQQLPRCDVS